MDKHANEERFKAELEKYIITDRESYEYGGIVNAINNIYFIMEKQFEATGIQDFKTAMDALDELVEKIDLSYEAN